MKFNFELACCLVAAIFGLGAGRLSEVWRFDRLDRIGGHPATLVGHPQILLTPMGKAVQFNGVDDAIFLDVHPLANAGAFTWEVIFRPDEGGGAEQRFFHLQADGSDDRMLFEIRVIGDEWCLDSFAKSGKESKALLNRTKLHRLGQWYSAATVYDGKELRNYVDGVPQGSGEVHLDPQKPGGTSVGVRFNRIDYFKGAILSARMTRRALSPSEFLKARNGR